MATKPSWRNNVATLWCNNVATLWCNYVHLNGVMVWLPWTNWFKGRPSEPRGFCDWLISCINVVTSTIATNFMLLSLSNMLLTTLFISLLFTPPFPFACRLTLWSIEMYVMLGMRKERRKTDFYWKIWPPFFYTCKNCPIGQHFRAQKKVNMGLKMGQNWVFKVCTNNWDEAADISFKYE